MFPLIILQQSFEINKGIYGETLPGAIVGGNCNNGRQCGALCSNVNNLASNTNWNVGATKSYSSIGTTTKCTIFSSALAEN